MSQLSFLKGLLEYDHTMNMTQLAKLQEAGWPEEPVKLLCHLSDSQLVWCDRAEGKAAANQVWHNYDVETLEKRLNESYQRWKNYLETLTNDALESRISYNNLKGIPQNDKLGDIIFHVMNHGTHHRGQMSTMVRQGGGTPEVMDYIAYVRKKG